MAESRRFRFGITLQAVGVDRRAFTDAARRAEQAGFSVVTVMDHFRSGGIWAALVAAHDAAPSLRVGTLVLNSDLLHPLLVAREAVTTDVMTDGSLELGLGAGWDVEDYRALGRARSPASVRLERLAEAISILRQAGRGEPPQVDGRHYVAEAPDGWPKPAQDSIPLLVGGGGRAVLELAAKTADIVSIARNMQRGMSGSWSRGDAGLDGGSARMDERVGWVRSAAGDRFASLELQVNVGRALFSSDREAAAAAIGGPLGLTAADVLDSPHFLVGSAEQMAEDLESRCERWGVSYFTVPAANMLDGDVMHRFSRLVARLGGAPSTDR